MAWGARSTKRLESAIIRPQVGASGEEPTPRKLSTDSVTMQRGRTIAAWVTSAPAMFGRMCRRRMWSLPPLKLAAAWT